MANFFSACNIAHPASLPKFEKGSLSAVHIARNVDFVDGNFKRRGGYTLVSAMTGAHSLFSADNDLYLVRDSKLYRVTNLVTYTEVEVASLMSNAALAHARYNGATYLSNGTDALVLNEAAHTVLSWIIPAPAAPTGANAAGSLNPGNYRVAVLQRDSASGRRSPVSPQLEVPLTTGVTLTLPALASGMTHTDVFMSDANGGTLYYQATTTGTSVTVASFSATGRQLPTHRQTCLPAGGILAAFKGRLLSAKDNLLMVSDAYYPTITDAVKGFVPFPADITAVVPVDSGVWVGTTAEQYFLAGTDPAKWEIGQSRKVSVAAGSSFSDDATKLRGWFDGDGVRILSDTGEAESPQARVFAPRFATSATCYFDRRTENVVAMLHGAETMSQREDEKYAELQLV